MSISALQRRKLRHGKAQVLAEVTHNHVGAWETLQVSLSCPQDLCCEIKEHSENIF